MVALSGNTDCYQPVERKLGITRHCLEVFVEFKNPVAVVTKSALVARDADLLGALARDGAAHVLCSVTTLDPELARRMEPRAATPERRLEAIAALTAAGVPVGVLIAPVVAGLNDAEIPRLLEAAAQAGARSASWVLLRLPKPVDELFDRWLAEQYPERRERVLGRIRETRAGRLSDSAFADAQRGRLPPAATRGGAARAHVRVMRDGRGPLQACRDAASRLHSLPGDAASGVHPLPGLRAYAPSPRIWHVPCVLQARGPVSA